MEKVRKQMISYLSLTGLVVKSTKASNFEGKPE